MYQHTDPGGRQCVDATRDASSNQWIRLRIGNGCFVNHVSDLRNVQVVHPGLGWNAAENRCSINIIILYNTIISIYNDLLC